MLLNQNPNSLNQNTNSIELSQLDTCIPFFAELGISAELLAQAFDSTPQPDFFQLYLACKRIKSVVLRMASPALDITEPWQLYCLCDENVALAFIEEAAEEENALSNYRDNVGLSPFHYIAFYGNIIVLDAALSLFKNADTHRDKLGRHILHYAALSGVPQAIVNILAEFPHLANIPDQEKINFICYVFWSGTTAAIEDVFANHATSVAAIAADILFIYAARSGTLSAINLVLQHYPVLKVASDSIWLEALLEAAHAGSVAGMDAILTWRPHLAERGLLEKTGGKGSLNIVFAAAWSGSLAALEYALQRAPQLAESRSYCDWNLFHYAAASRSPVFCQNLMLRYPHLIHRLWVRSEDGITPNMIAQGVNMTPDLLQIQHELLVAATDALVNAEASSEMINFLDAFNNAWLRYLKRCSGIPAEERGKAFNCLDAAHKQSLCLHLEGRERCVAPSLPLSPSKNTPSLTSAGVVERCSLNVSSERGCYHACAAKLLEQLHVGRIPLVLQRHLLPREDVLMTLRLKALATKDRVLTKERLTDAVGLAQQVIAEHQRMLTARLTSSFVSRHFFQLSPSPFVEELMHIVRTLGPATNDTMHGQADPFNSFMKPIDGTPLCQKDIQRLNTVLCEGKTQPDKHYFDVDNLLLAKLMQTLTMRSISEENNAIFNVDKEKDKEATWPLLKLVFGG